MTQVGGCGSNWTPRSRSPPRTGACWPCCAPATLPPGFAARYEPAAAPLEIGGDWYDIVELPDGRIGIVVGDCVGHALQSATIMGQLRSACGALLLRETSPAQTLAAMDRFAAVIPGGICSTVFCGAGIPRRDAEATLRPRATLMLYTDGLVERRRRGLDTGIAQPAAALAAGNSLPVPDLATQIMAGLAPPGGYEDDVALLLYRYPGPLELTFPADLDQLAPVRASLRQWLSRCDLSARAAQDILVAAGEACANAFEHGSGGAGQQITLTAAVTATDLYLTVADSGRWKDSAPAPGSYRGHGIPLMRALMSQVSITTTDGGTTVHMRLRIAP